MVDVEMIRAGLWLDRQDPQAVNNHSEHSFDAVFESTHAALELVRPLVEDVAAGVANATVIGLGKRTDLALLAGTDLLELLPRGDSAARVSFVEMSADEEVRDVLLPRVGATHHVLDDRVTGAHEEIVVNGDELAAMLKGGRRGRTAVVKLAVERRAATGVVAATFTFVELASLAVFESLVATLSSGGTPSFRSKLSRILRPGLAGNSRTVVVARVDGNDTGPTLRVASRARRIMTTPSPTADATFLPRLRNEINDLKTHVAAGRDDEPRAVRDDAMAAAQIQQLQTLLGPLSPGAARRALDFVEQAKARHLAGRPSLLFAHRQLVAASILATKLGLLTSGASSPVNARPLAPPEPPSVALTRISSDGDDVVATEARMPRQLEHDLDDPAFWHDVASSFVSDETAIQPVNQHQADQTPHAAEEHAATSQGDDASFEAATATLTRLSTPPSDAAAEAAALEALKSARALEAAVATTGASRRTAALDESRAAIGELETQYAQEASKLADLEERHGGSPREARSEDPHALRQRSSAVPAANAEPARRRATDDTTLAAIKERRSRLESEIEAARRSSQSALAAAQAAELEVQSLRVLMCEIDDGEVRALARTKQTEVDKAKLELTMRRRETVDETRATRHAARPRLGDAEAKPASKRGAATWVQEQADFDALREAAAATRARLAALRDERAAALAAREATAHAARLASDDTDRVIEQVGAMRDAVIAAARRRRDAESDREAAQASLEATRARARDLEARILTQESICEQHRADLATVWAPDVDLAELRDDVAAARGTLAAHHRRRDEQRRSAQSLLAHAASLAAIDDDDDGADGALIVPVGGDQVVDEASALRGELRDEERRKRELTDEIEVLRVEAARTRPIELSLAKATAEARSVDRDKALRAALAAEADEAAATALVDAQTKGAAQAASAAARAESFLAAARARTKAQRTVVERAEGAAAGAREEATLAREDAATAAAELAEAERRARAAKRGRAKPAPDDQAVLARAAAAARAETAALRARCHPAAVDDQGHIDSVRRAIRDERAKRAAAVAHMEADVRRLDAEVARARAALEATTHNNTPSKNAAVDRAGLRSAVNALTSDLGAAQGKRRQLDADFDAARASLALALARRAAITADVDLGATRLAKLHEELAVFRKLGVYTPTKPVDDDDTTDEDEKPPQTPASWRGYTPASASLLLPTPPARTNMDETPI